MPIDSYLDDPLWEQIANNEFLSATGDTTSEGLAIYGIEMAQLLASIIVTKLESNMTSTLAEHENGLFIYLANRFSIMSEYLKVFGKELGGVAVAGAVAESKALPLIQMMGMAKLRIHGLDASAQGPPFNGNTSDFSNVLMSITTAINGDEEKGIPGASNAGAAEFASEESKPSQVGDTEELNPKATFTRIQAVVEESMQLAGLLSATPGAAPAKLEDSIMAMYPDQGEAILAAMEPAYLKIFNEIVAPQVAAAVLMPPLPAIPGTTLGLLGTKLEDVLKLLAFAAPEGITIKQTDVLDPETGEVVDVEIELIGEMDGAAAEGEGNVEDGDDAEGEPNPESAKSVEVILAGQIEAMIKTVINWTMILLNIGMEMMMNVEKALMEGSTKILSLSVPDPGSSSLDGTGTNLTTVPSPAIPGPVFVDDAEVPSPAPNQLAEGEEQQIFSPINWKLIHMHHLLACLPPGDLRILGILPADVMQPAPAPSAS